MIGGRSIVAAAVTAFFETLRKRYGSTFVFTTNANISFSVFLPFRSLLNLCKIRVFQISILHLIINLPTFYIQEHFNRTFVSRPYYLQLIDSPPSVLTSTFHLRFYPSFAMFSEIPQSLKPFVSLLSERFSTSLPIITKFLVN